MDFTQSFSLTINKKQKYFLLQDNQLAENLIVIFGFCERARMVLKQIGN